MKLKDQSVAADSNEQSVAADVAATSGVAANRPKNEVSLGFVEGLNNEIRVSRRRAYGLRDEERLSLKILICTFPELWK